MLINVLLVLHIIITISLVGIILLQKSEGGALGMGGGAKFGGMFSAKGAGNFLTKLTAILATSFFVTSTVLALLVAKKEKKDSLSLLDEIEAKEVGESKVNKIPEEQIIKTAEEAKRVRHENKEDNKPKVPVE